VNSTRVVGEAIAGAARAAARVLQMSTATSTRTATTPNDEADGHHRGRRARGTDTWRFSIDVATRGSARSRRRAPHAQGRAARGGGDEPQTGAAVRLLLAPGALRPRRQSGHGRQYVSWITIGTSSRRRLADRARQDRRRRQPRRAPSPAQRRFMRACAQAWGCAGPCPPPAWMLEIAARGAPDRPTGAQEPPRSCRRLVTQGFAFDVPTWPEGRAHLCRRRRE